MLLHIIQAWLLAAAQQQQLQVDDDDSQVSDWELRHQQPAYQTP
jgi:hypothetical protein